MNTNERYELNKNLAQMLKGGVIMDVTTPEQAKIAEAAGACAVMALERIPGPWLLRDLRKVQRSVLHQYNLLQPERWQRHVLPDYRT